MVLVTVKAVPTAAFTPAHTVPCSYKSPELSFLLIPQKAFSVHIFHSHILSITNRTVLDFTPEDSVLMELSPVPFFSQEDYSHFYNLFLDMDSAGDFEANNNAMKRHRKEDKGGGNGQKNK